MNHFLSSGLSVPFHCLDFKYQILIHAHPSSSFCYVDSKIIQLIAPALSLCFCWPLFKFIFQPQLGSLHPHTIFICSYSYTLHLNSIHQMFYKVVACTHYAGSKTEKCALNLKQDKKTQKTELGNNVI